jgi:hypothetical protein
MSAAGIEGIRNGPVNGSGEGSFRCITLTRPRRHRQCTAHAVAFRFQGSGFREQPFKRRFLSKPGRIEYDPRLRGSVSRRIYPVHYFAPKKRKRHVSSAYVIVHTGRSFQRGPRNSTDYFTDKDRSALTGFLLRQQAYILDGEHFLVLRRSGLTACVRSG